VVAFQKEPGLPIKFIGLGEQPDDLQPFDACPYIANHGFLHFSVIR
jgi:fused signal recognition particle receptor